MARFYEIRESSHRIINPLTPEKLATLGAAIGLHPGDTLLDLGCGKGELLCTWARDHGVTGTGVDINPAFVRAAQARASELGVTESVRLLCRDATAHVSSSPVDVGVCSGATWIGGDFAGTVALLERSLRPGGMVLIGEPYWLREPTPETRRALFGDRDHSCLLLPDLVEHIHTLGWDLVEMVLASPDSWDRYVAAGWLNQRRWLDQNPDDELAPMIREDLTQSQLNHVRHQRDNLGWGIFAMVRR